MTDGPPLAEPVAPRGPAYRVDHLRRIDGHDVVFHPADGYRWLDLGAGYRVQFHRLGSGWVVTRAGSAWRIARARTLTEAYRRARRHYLALGPSG